MGAAAARTVRASAAPPAVRHAGPAGGVRIGEVDGPAEREADGLADAALSGRLAGAPRPEGPPNVVHRACTACASGGPPCPSCAEDEDVLQLKAAPPVVAAATTATAAGTQAAEAAAAAVRSGGAPLPHAVAGYFAPRFGADLSHVRIHTDGAAGAAARAIGARAYALGSDVAFAPGAFRPETDAGRRLIAHEIAHTLASPAAARGATMHRQPDPETEVALAGGSVSFVTVDCARNTIVFETTGGEHAYDLTNCEAAPGLYSAGVTVDGNDVSFSGTPVAGVEEGEGEGAFDFRWRIDPGQPNPATFFAGQTSVPILVTGGALGGGRFVVVAEGPVTFEGEALGPAPHVPVSGAAPSAHMLASGEHLWESRHWSTETARTRAAGRLFTPGYYSPMLPRVGTQDVDRLLSTLPRSLTPKSRTEAFSTGAQGTAGITQAEIRQMPELVRKWNLSLEGGPPLSTREMEVLRKVADLHVGGTPKGTPFMSFTTPDTGGTADLGWKKATYRVRVEMPRLDVLDVTVPSALTQGTVNLPNADEMELMVATDERMRILNVQRVDGPTGADPGFLMKHGNKIRWGGRALFVLDMARAGHRIGTASPEERAVVIGEEVGGQAGGWGGAAVGAGACIVLGLATSGLGLLVCGLAGGAVGSELGSRVGGGLVRGLQEGGGEPCPSCHSMQRAWEAERERSPFVGRETPESFQRFGLSQAAGRGEQLTAEEIEAIRAFILSPSPEEATE